MGSLEHGLNQICSEANQIIHPFLREQRPFGVGRSKQSICRLWLFYFVVTLVDEFYISRAAKLNETCTYCLEITGQEADCLILNETCTYCIEITGQEADCLIKLVAYWTIEQISCYREFIRSKNYSLNSLL